MFKRLFYALLLGLTFIIAACGSGVATYPPDNKTETFEAALSGETLPAESTEPAVLATESTFSDNDGAVTVEPTPIEIEEEFSTFEAEIATESTPSDTSDRATVEPTGELPTTMTTTDVTLALSEMPPTEVKALPTEVATELPETATTEPVATSRAEVATVAPTETSEPTATLTATPKPTDTPEPTATATATPTDTPEPTATLTSTPAPTATSTSTDTPEPTTTVTSTSTDTPEPTETATSTSTDTPEPTATVTSTSTDTPEPTATATSTSTDTPEPTATVTSTSTNTPEPTATATPTNTPEPTATVTSTSTNTPEPTATATAIPTDTPEPTATLTSTPTDTPEPTATATATPTDTPEPTATLTSTSTDTPVPTATATVTPTNTPEPVELEPYQNESLGITFDYSPIWSEPIEDDNAIIVIPSENIEDTAAGNVTILRGTPAEIADEFVVEVDTETPEAFLESLAEDLENAEIDVLELEDNDLVATELIGIAEEDNQTIRAIVMDIEDEWIVIIGIAPTDSFETFSTEVMDVILQNLEIGEPETLEPVESTQYEGEAVGLEFEYQEDSAIEREGNTLTIQLTINDVSGDIFIARGTPEDLLAEGYIDDDSNPRAALLSLEPESDPFVSEQFDPSFQAWTVTIETTDGNEAYTQRLYIVAIRTEWVFIRTTALSEDFDEADEQIFAPLLESIIILDEIPE